MKIDEKSELLAMHMLSNVDYKYNEYELQNFNKIFAYSNEQVCSTMRGLDIAGKDVLTVGSSGDQILFAQLFGANSVTCFDINPFVKQVYDYKVAAIKALTYEQANKMMTSDHLFDPATYAKISSFIKNKDSKLFWDDAYLNGFDNDQGLQFISSIYNCEYIENEKLFNALKQKLNEKNLKSVKYIRCDLKELNDKLPKNAKFDYIMLSNIYDHIGFSWVSMPEDHDSRFTSTDILFKNVVNKLATHLNKHGEIQVHYLWNKQRLHHLNALFDGCTYEMQLPQENRTVMYVPENVKTKTEENEM